MGEVGYPFPSCNFWELHCPKRWQRPSQSWNKLLHVSIPLSKSRRQGVGVRLLFRKVVGGPRKLSEEFHIWTRLNKQEAQIKVHKARQCCSEPRVSAPWPEPLGEDEFVQTTQAASSHSKTVVLTSWSCIQSRPVAMHLCCNCVTRCETRSIHGLIQQMILLCLALEAGTPIQTGHFKWEVCCGLQHKGGPNAMQLPLTLLSAPLACIARRIIPALPFSWYYSCLHSYNTLF